MAAQAPSSSINIQAAPRPWLMAATLACFAGATCAQSQEVAPADTPLQTRPGKQVNTARIDWNDPDANDQTGLHGKGLIAIKHSLWPQWEGRIGMLVNRPLSAIKSSFALAYPAESGLGMRGLHVLSDYYFAGGFRATAGLVRGETSQAWWSSGEHGGGLSLSLQKLDSLGLLGNMDAQARANALDGTTNTYVGAGYSTRLNTRSSFSPWRFNADLGLITINSNNIGRITQVLQGDRRLEDIARDLRLRPLIKVSVGYAF